MPEADQQLSASDTKRDIFHGKNAVEDDVVGRSEFDPGAIVVQQMTRLPVQFELFEPARSSLLA